MNDELNNINNDDAGAGRLLNELGDLRGGEPLNDPFEQDSNEGLSQLSKEKARLMIDSLNHNLHQHIRKSRKRESKLPGFSFLYISIITVLLLIIIAWLVIRKIHP